MRAETTKHYATSVTQYERFTGGIAWDNPNNALAINGNIGARIGDVIQISDTKYPLGPGYPWGIRATHSQYDYGFDVITKSDWIDPPPFYPSATDNQKFPNGLRFSGFNISDATGDCIVTNMFVHVEYKDSTPEVEYMRYIAGIEGVPTEFLYNGGNWLVTATKSGNITYKKRFDSVKSTTTNVVYSARIPCQTDQSWATNTFGSGTVPGLNQKGRKIYEKIRNWWKTNVYTSNRGTWSILPGTTEYLESTADIKPLTIAEINDPNFYVDLWYSRTQGSSGNVRVYSVSISVEYVKPASKSVTLYYKKTPTDYPRQVNLGFGYQTPWVNPKSAGGPPDASLISMTEIPPIGDTDYAYVNVFAHAVPYHNTGGMNDQLIRWDTNYILGRFDAIPDLDDSKEISDIILDVRVNGVETHLGPVMGHNWSARWTYLLTDGIGPEHIAQGQNLPGETIYKFAIQGADPGIREGYPVSRTYQTTSEMPTEKSDWLNWLGEYNPNDGEYYGVEGEYWYTKHFPIRRNSILHTPYPKIINTAIYPGLTYDPLWMEKAFKTGKMYVGLVFTIDLGTTLISKFTSPPQVGWLKLESVALRVKYTSVDVPGVPGGPSSGDGLIYRYTP